jgi:hypothetical protein
MDPITIPLVKWPSAAGQLIVQSLRHPFTEKAITIEDDTVRVVPVEEAPADEADAAADTASSARAH